MSTWTAQRNGVNGICLGLVLVAITTAPAVLLLVAISSVLAALA